MKPELNSDSACSACVDTGRTGHDVIASGWSNAESIGSRTLRLFTDRSRAGSARSGRD